MQPKTKVMLAGAVGLAFVLNAAADYPSTVISQGPVAYWQLNETASPPAPVTTAVNLGSSGVSFDATYVGSQAFMRQASGAFGTDKAALFDGVSQAVKAPYSVAHSTPGFTAEAWLAPTFIGAAVPGGLTAAMCSLDGADPRAGWLLYQSGTGWSLRLYNQNGLNVSLNLNVVHAMTAGTYYHMVVTFDGTTARVYANGVLLGFGTPTGTPVYVPSTAGVFSVGTRSDNAFYWAGKADEVAFYPTVLSSNTVAAHYAAATTNVAGYSAQILGDGALLYYRLNEAGGSGVANSGTLGAAAIAEVAYPGLLNQAGPSATSTPSLPGFAPGNTGLSDNTGGYLTAKALNLNTNKVTMTMWVKPNGGQVGRTGLLMSRARLAAGGAYSSTAGIIVDAAGGLNLAYNWDGDDNTHSWASGIGMTDGQWNFVALVVEPTQATLCIHNGSTFQTAVNTVNHAVLAFEGPFYGGMDPFTGVATTTRKFVGSLDEIAVFNKALSLGQVYTEYATAAGALPPTLFADLAAPAGTTYEGDPLTLAVDAGGTANLSIQWRKGATAIPNATNLSYTIPSLALGDSGSYDVIITNLFGVTNSSAAGLTVAPKVAPTITEDISVPARTTYTNGEINLRVAAIGGAVKYQWQKGGVDIANQTNASLRITGVVGASAGTYRCMVTNSAGFAQSANCVVTVSSGSLNSYEASIAADSPISWYRLNDSGSVMLDSMGRGDGFYSNSVVLGAPGAITGNPDKSVHFDLAANAWGEVATPPVTTGEFTLECWVRVTNTAAANLYPVSSFRNQYGVFFYRGDDGLWRTGDGYGDLDGTTANRVGSHGPATAGQWFHLVQVYSGVTGTLPTGSKTYVNGIWDGAGPFVDFSRNKNTPFKIGSITRSGIASYFDGEVDEVAFYNKALTDARIGDHYAKALFGTTTAPFFVQQPASQVVRIGTTTVSFAGVANGSSPISYQWFKNGSPIIGSNATTLAVPITGYLAAPDQYQLRATNGAGTNFSVVATLSVMPTNPPFVYLTNNLVLHLKGDTDFLDYSGRGNHATAVGSPAIVPGIVGNAVHTATTNGLGVFDYLTLGAPADLQFNTSVDFSVSYWVKYPAGWTNGDLPFLCSATNSYGNPGVTIAPSYNVGGWSYSLNGVVQLYGAANSINDGNWHNIVHSFNRTGFATTYRDGVQVDQRLMTSAGNVDTGAPFNIGQDASGIYTEDGLSDLDDLSVWRKALTAYDAYAINYVGRTHGKSFDQYGPVTLDISKSGGNVQVLWTAGTLQSADAITGPWTNVAGANAPYYVAPASAAAKFYRVQL